MRKVILYFILFIIIQCVVTYGVTMLWDMNADPSASLGGKMIAASAASNAVILASFLVRRWIPADMMRVSHDNILRVLSPWHIVLGLSALVPLLWIEGLIPESLKQDVLADVLPEMLSSPWGYIAVGLLAPVAEEVVFRGAILHEAYGVFSKNVGERPEARWTAIIMTAFLFAGGIAVGWFIAGGSLAVGALTIIILATDYMTTRITMWRNPWDDALGKGMQAIQSMLAIGSGGLFGVGLGNSRQKFLYLPESQNDFIFAVVCEELGLVGATLILAIFALLIIRGYWLALHARDKFGSLVIVGITTLFAFQVFANVAVVSNLFPVTGISLPFFSYGGTALLIQMAEMGLVLSISRQNPIN